MPPNDASKPDTRTAILEAVERVIVRLLWLLWLRLAARLPDVSLELADQVRAVSHERCPLIQVAVVCRV